jgi:hypothetical protein
VAGCGAAFWANEAKLIKSEMLRVKSTFFIGMILISGY